jgi:hypothetical protein
MYGDPGVSHADVLKHMVYGFVMSPFHLNPYFLTRMYYGDVSKAEHVESMSYAVIWSGAVINAAYVTGQIVTPGQGYSLVARGIAATPLLAAPIMLAAPLTLGYAANVQVAKQMPSHEQSSFWQSVAQALTGTGPGIGGADIGI